MKLLAFIALLIAACASNNAKAVESSNVFTVNGIYKYSDGDRITWKCNAKLPCTELLIRDWRLAQSATKLLNQRVSLRVRRVDACGPQSSQVACLRSRNGTALLIVEWL
jgi:hypothetical protein